MIPEELVVVRLVAVALRASPRTVPVQVGFRFSRYDPPCALNLNCAEAASSLAVSDHNSPVVAGVAVVLLVEPVLVVGVGDGETHSAVEVLQVLEGLDVLEHRALRGSTTRAEVSVSGGAALTRSTMLWQRLQLRRHSPTQLFLHISPPCSSLEIDLDENTCVLIIFCKNKSVTRMDGLIFRSMLDLVDPEPKSPTRRRQISTARRVGAAQLCLQTAGSAHAHLFSPDSVLRGVLSVCGRLQGRNSGCTLVDLNDQGRIAAVRPRALR